MLRRSFLLLLAAAGLCAQARHPLTGRPIAGVMGMGGADWLERPEREMEEEPEKALDAIGVRGGSTIADIGAGVGYFTLRLSRRVGPRGKVYASDIQPGMLARLQQRARQDGLTNIQTVLSTPTDPTLPPSSFDLALLVDVYHEFSHPREMLAGLAAALKPDGRLVLIEYRKEDPSVPIREEHKMSVGDVRRELEAEGFVFDRVLETLRRQHILIFRNKTASR